MKVILLEDLKSLGKKGEIVEVKDGYAKNMLLPKKLGVEATTKNLNDLKLKKANEEKVTRETLAAAQAIAKELETKEVVVSMKVGKDGKTFGSVSSKEIAQAAKEQFGIDLDKKKIVLNDAIKSLGTYVVKLKLHAKVSGELKVKVVEQ